MTYVLDTNAVSALMKGAPAVVDRLAATEPGDVGVRSRSLERRGSRIEAFDVAIAAHALALGATLVTSNVEHMTRVPGIRVEDWGE